MTFVERKSIFGKIDLPIKRILTPKPGRALDVLVGNLEDEEFRDNKETPVFEMEVASEEHVVVGRPNQSRKSRTIFMKKAVNDARIIIAEPGRLIKRKIVYKEGR